MTFDELLQEVYNLTNRPDLVNETKSAIKAATLKAHHSDFYSKDIFENYVTFTSSDYVHSWDYVTLASNFRALKYLRKYDATAGSVGDFIEVISVDEVLDSYNIDRTDVAYVAGRVLEIKSSTEIQNVIVGMYVSPIIVEAEYSSWVADLFPYAIVFEAARIVFKTIGYAEQAAAYEKFVQEEYATLRMSALTDQGY